MSEIKKITKLAIFIDYDNFTITYGNRFDIKTYDIQVWEDLCDQFSSLYKEKFIKNDFEVVDHIGTFACVGISDFPTDTEIKLRKNFQELDRKNGFIMKYASRKNPRWDNDTKRKEMGMEKGVDTEIVCQMLMGAFLNHYDACILFSDDADYYPAINRIQDYFGKKFIHAGYSNNKIRECSYGNIPLENYD